MTVLMLLILRVLWRITAYDPSRLDPYPNPIPIPNPNPNPIVLWPHAKSYRHRAEP